MNQLRVYLAKAGLLPKSMMRKGNDRRVQGERRIRKSNQYLISEGADRRFEPERRRFAERRVSEMDILDMDELG